MKKVMIVLFVIGALALLPAGVRARANVINVQDYFSLEGRIVNTPDGCEDLIHTSGRVHVTAHITDLGDGDRLVAVHFNPQNAVAEGMETGTIYRGVGVTSFMERTLGPGESYTFVNVFMQVPHVGIQEVVHTTVNANGEITSEIDHSVIPGFDTCNG